MNQEIPQGQTIVKIAGAAGDPFGLPDEVLQLQNQSDYNLYILETDVLSAGDLRKPPSDEQIKQSVVVEPYKVAFISQAEDGQGHYAFYRYKGFGNIQASVAVA